MKRTFSIILALFVIVYGKQAYDVFTAYYFSYHHTSGTLSDIAEEVVAIPLDTKGGEQIDKVKNIRQVGNDLFLISNGVLYRFAHNGELICRITQPEELQVAGYVVNEVNRELIVLGNTDDIFYYTYEGNILEKKKMKSDLAHHRLETFSMFGDKIWTVEEAAFVDEDTLETTIQKRVVTYDRDFEKLETRMLVSANLGRNQFLTVNQTPRLFVEKDTGMVYAVSPELVSDNILQDTLFVKTNWRSQLSASYYQNTVPVFPMSFGSRYWLSVCSGQEKEEDNYTFCYDNTSYFSWQAKGGLKDNFYKTGLIPDLEAIDIYARSYAYAKSGKEVKKAFPGRKANDNAVVFIVKLKA